MSIVGALIFAWFLSLFNLDTILVSGINEVFGTDYSTNIYWLTAFVIGITATIIELIVKKFKSKKSED